jgi:hypothetical protein
MAFTEPKKTPDGRYYVKALEPRLVQLNKVNLLSKYSDGDSLTIGLSESHQEKIFAIDSENIAAAKQNSELWFQRVVAEKTLEAAYTKSFSDGVMNVSKSKQAKVFTDKMAVDGSELTESSVGDVVLEFSGITFTKTKFAPVWRLLQTRTLTPPKKKYDEYLFQDDEPVQESSDEEFA